jgi:UDPglucose 6-dehydrogenase
MQECRRIYGERADLVLTGSRDEALTGADALVVATDWRSFQAPDFDLVKTSLATPVIFDGRNLYDPDVVAKHGILYYGIGRSNVAGDPATGAVQKTS